MSESLKDKKFPVLETLAMACCIYREKGYTSTSAYLPDNDDGGKRWNNREHLSYQMIPSLANSDYKVLFKVTREDMDNAGDIIKHFRKLSFGILGNTLNDYMARVFKITQNEEVSINEFGVLASVPQVYEREVTEKIVKDVAKNSIQGHFGEVGESVTLNIKYLRSKFVEKIGCYSHEAITDTNYLVGFLNKEQLGTVGASQTIRAKIKKHGENFTTKTPETQLNYVKVVDREFVWQ